MPGQVEVGQRTLKHDRRLVADSRRLDGTGNGHQLFLTISVGEVERVVLDGRSDEHREARVAIVLSDLVNAGEQIVQALMETGVEQPLSGNDIHPLEPGQSRKQIEVGRPQSSRVGSPIGNRDHHVPKGPNRWHFPEQFAKALLVQASRRGHAALVGAERRHQKPCLAQQASRATVHLGAGLQLTGQQTLENVDRATLPAELVVQP